MPDFSRRSSEPELMDDLGSSGDVIVQTLKELDTINKWLGGNGVSIAGLKKLLASRPDVGKKVVTIADIGCGGGDMMKLIANWGRRHDYRLQLVGIDANPAILAYARENTKDYPEISYQQIDIYSKEFRSLRFDVIHTSLFTHHFSTTDLISFFSQWNQQARLGIVNNDLHRHWFAYHSIDWLTRLFSKSWMVKNDARLSVLRSFSAKDWNGILHQASISNYHIQWRWAFRWELVVYK